MGKASVRPGPYAGFPDGYCQAARAVIREGHALPTPTAHWARNALIDPARSGEDRLRAFACLARLIEEQVAEPRRVPGFAEDARGTWCWTLGDSMGRGPSPNMEDFVGTALVEIFRHDAVAGHADWPAGLVGRLRECVAAAVRCSQRRRVRVSYTNPLAMSIELSALAGEMFEMPDCVEYARQRLAEWIAFTERAGTFEEFNSSCYGGVTMPHTATLAEHVRDADVRERALYMERKYFDHVCDFYHHPTREACMPRSREYSDRFAGTQLHDYLCAVLRVRRPGAFPLPRMPAALAAITYSHATDGQIDRLLEGFAAPAETAVFSEWIGLDHVGWLDQVPPPARGPHARRRLLTARREERFCVGSVSEIDSWHQRRSLGGHVRTPAGSALVAWKPRIEVAGAVERDYDLKRLWPVVMFFNLSTGQDGRTVLAGLSGIPVDADWLCGSHWRQKVEGTVEGISADFGFDIDEPGEAPPPAELKIGQVWRHRIGDCTLSLLVMGGHVGDTQAEPSVRKEEKVLRVSLLRKEGFSLDWSRPPEVGLAFVLDISPTSQAPAIEGARWGVSGTVLECAAVVGARRLTLRYDPPGVADLTRQARFFSVAGAG